MSKIIIILSVDWETDHGKWKYNAKGEGYRGILGGTPLLLQLLDKLEIPCTWFIETSQETERNTAGLFPDIINKLSSRKRDEIGLHIHWRKLKNKGTVSYETNDQDWVSSQV